MSHSSKSTLFHHKYATVHSTNRLVLTKNFSASATGPVEVFADIPCNRYRILGATIHFTQIYDSSPTFKAVMLDLSASTVSNLMSSARVPVAGTTYVCSPTAGFSGSFADGTSWAASDNFQIDSWTNEGIYARNDSALGIPSANVDAVPGFQFTEATATVTQDGTMTWIIDVLDDAIFD